MGRSKERETRPHGKRNGTEDEDENKNSTRNSTRRPNGKNSHRTDDEDEDNYHGGELDDEGEDEDENLDVVVDRILANLKEFKQYAIAQFKSKNFTNHAFERLGDRFETVQKELKNYRYKFYKAAEKMNNKTRVNELMEKTHLMEKISRELNKMGEEKENQGKGPDGPHEKDDEDEDEDENLDVVADRILANLNQFKQYAIVQFQSKNFTESAFKRIEARFEDISREMKNYNYYFEQAAEKMNNKTRVRELMEKTHLMKKISREIRKMGEEAENELPRYKNRRETRPHGKENQGKGPDGPHEKDDEDED